MDDVTRLAGMDDDNDEAEDGPMFDAPLSALSFVYCDDAFFG
jgi:hypothetical protein